MSTELDYICSQSHGVKGKFLPKYYKETIAKIFVIEQDRVLLGDCVVTMIESATRETTVRDDIVTLYGVITSYDNREIIEHELWNDEDGCIHERTVQAIKEYTGGDAVLNHYNAILLWAQKQGIQRFYSDYELSPGTIKIYEKLRVLGWKVQGPCDNIESIGSSGNLKSSMPIYYIEL